MMEEIPEEAVEKYEKLMAQLFYQIPTDIKQKVFDIVTYINGIKDFDKSLDMYDVIRWKITTTIDWEKISESSKKV